MVHLSSRYGHFYYLYEVLLKNIVGSFEYMYLGKIFLFVLIGAILLFLL